MEFTTGRPALSRASLTYSSPDDPLFKRWLINGVEQLTGRRRLERLYEEVRRQQFPPHEIWAVLLRKLNIQVLFDADRLRPLPREAPLVFIANHPFGVVDGLILGFLVAQVRPDFKILVNEVLCREALLAPFLLPIDFRESREAMATNLHTRSESLRRLGAGEALAIFPAGGVSTAPTPWGAADDLEWKRFVARLIQQTRATVVPLYLPGQNSRLFQVVSQFSLNLRLGLLLHEVRNKMGRQIPVHIGRPVPFEELAHLKNRQQLLDHLRALTYALAELPG